MGSHTLEGKTETEPVWNLKNVERYFASVLGRERLSGKRNLSVILMSDPPERGINYDCLELPRNYLEKIKERFEPRARDVRMV